mgnify:CR=1 FL=1
MSQTTEEPLLSPELLARLERLEFVSRKIFRGKFKGERRSKRKGQSVEFADFRNYVVGDDLRFIDWNTYARLDRLFLKLFLEEEDLHFYCLVDTSRSMEFGEPTKLHFARQLAAALGFVGLIRADRVRIEPLGPDKPPSAPMLRGRSSLWRMLDYLNSFEAGEAQPLAASVKQFCLRNPGQGIVVLVSDLLDRGGYEEALRYLLARRMDVYVVQVLAQEEFDPELAGDLRLVDCEDQDVAEVTISAPLLKKYKQTLAAFLASVREFCHARGMVHLVANNQTPVDQLILSYLRQRGLVR